MVLEASESKFNVPGDSVSKKHWSMCFQVEGLMLHLQVAELTSRKVQMCSLHSLPRGAKDRYNGRATMF